MAQADGLLVFPAEAERLEAGSAAEVQVLSEDFLAETESGL